MDSPLPSIDSLVFLRDSLKAKVSLHEFLKQAWHVIEGELPFEDGWHIGAIAEHLEALANREIKRLLINIPPRHCKSTLISVAFPVWRWLSCPQERFMFASYAKSLSIRDSTKCRRLILSPWFQERYGDIFSLQKDQNAKGRFDNDKSGYRLATSVGASATGEGANIIVCDDPNNVRDISQIKLENTIEWFTQVLLSRLNNPKEDCLALIQQRFHVRDVSGYILSHYDNHKWPSLILPYKFEENRRAKTIVLPSSGGKKWQDPRKEEGELLWREFKELENTLGEYGVAGQLQQRPSPKGGGVIKTSWFKLWKHSALPKIIFRVQSWDTAFSVKPNAAYSACTTWGVFNDDYNIPNVILLSSWRGRVEYPELRDIAKRLYYDYRDAGKERNLSLSGMPIDLCLIEAKASGDPLIRDLLLAGIKAHPVQVTSGDKRQRVSLVSSLIESGRVWLPTRGPSFERLALYADEFREAAASFPNAESNDLVDTMSQALMHLKEGALVFHPKDEREKEYPDYKEFRY